jgi:diadenosine tetraphosphate (Ap4A) HIT family hydrolase
VIDLLDIAKCELDTKHAPQGYNIGINDGAAAGQIVMRPACAPDPTMLGRQE